MKNFIKIFLFLLSLLFFLFPNSFFSTFSSKNIKTLNITNSTVPSQIIKILKYDISWGPLKLGEAKLYIKNEKYTAEVYTVGIGDFIYPYYAKWETYIDPEGYPLKSLIYSKHKSKERKREIIFDKKNGRVIYKKFLPKPKNPNIIFIKYPIYDELSAFIKSFGLDYSKNQIYEMPLFIKKRKEFVKIKFKKEKKCKFFNENRTCYLIKVELPPVSELLKRAGKSEMELLKNERYPVKLKGKLPLLGSLIGKLKEVKVLKVPCKNIKM